MPQILIVSMPGDVHAFAAMIALRKRGFDPFLFETPSFPVDISVSLAIENDRGLSIRVLGGPTRFDPLKPTSVWWRRPKFPELPDWIHPEDFDFALGECRSFLHGLWYLLATGESFWVNPLAAANQADSKVLQLSLARDIGFKIPPTLMSNDPEQIEQFIAGHHGRVVYKPFKPTHAVWLAERKTAEGSYKVAQGLYTSLVTRESLPKAAVLRVTPGIFQPKVEKSYELRVTMIGETAFAARIESQTTEKGKLDFRAAYDELRLTAVELPPSILSRCRQLISRLGLRFGCIDLIVTPEGEYIFLEVNESGQFLWVERMTRQPLLDEFVDLLIRQSSARTTASDHDAVLYRDITEEATELAERSRH